MSEIPIRHNNILKVFVKRKKLVSLIKQLKYYEKLYGDGYKTFLSCGLDITKRYIILSFVLRGE